MTHEQSCERCQERPAFIRWPGRDYGEIALCASCWLDLPESERRMRNLIEEFTEPTRGVAESEVAPIAAPPGRQPHKDKNHVAHSQAKSEPQPVRERLFDALGFDLMPRMGR